MLAAPASALALGAAELSGTIVASGALGGSVVDWQPASSTADERDGDQHGLRSRQTRSGQAM